MTQLINRIADRINELKEQGVASTDPRMANAVECLRRCGYKMVNGKPVSIEELKAELEAIKHVSEQTLEAIRKAYARKDIIKVNGGYLTADYLDMLLEHTWYTEGQLIDMALGLMR